MESGLNSMNNKVSRQDFYEFKDSNAIKRFVFIILVLLTITSSFFVSDLLNVKHNKQIITVLNESNYDRQQFSIENLLIFNWNNSLTISKNFTFQILYKSVSNTFNSSF
jgi:hypothetical protein